MAKKMGFSDGCFEVESSRERDVQDLASRMYEDGKLLMELSERISCDGSEPLNSYEKIVVRMTVANMITGFNEEMLTCVYAGNIPQVRHYQDRISRLIDLIS